MKVVIISENPKESIKLLPALKEMGFTKVVIKQGAPHKIALPLLDLQGELAKLDARQSETKFS